MGLMGNIPELISSLLSIKEAIRSGVAFFKKLSHSTHYIGKVVIAESVWLFKWKVSGI